VNQIRNGILWHSSSCWCDTVHGNIYKPIFLNLPTTNISLKLETVAKEGASVLTSQRYRPVLSIVSSYNDMFVVGKLTNIGLQTFSDTISHKHQKQCHSTTREYIKINIWITYLIHTYFPYIMEADLCYKV
jgi:hypothetical protein